VSESSEPNPPESPVEIVVFSLRRDVQCAECGRELFKGNFLRIEIERALCIDCADLGHLEFLPSGNTALTRRTSKYSPLRAVVVQWSRTRKRYERQGILAAPEAIRRAEAECLGDADQRARRQMRAAERREQLDEVFVAKVTAALRSQFPGCPADESAQIAEWTCLRGSGRVGRTSAAKELDPQALRLAMIAHIRHNHTLYVELLMQHGDRFLAREQVREAIHRVLTKWEQDRTR
jgi:hypothetical protein